MNFFIKLINRLISKNKIKLIESSTEKETYIEPKERRSDFIADLRNNANLEIDDKSRLWNYEHKNRRYGIDIWMRKI